MLRTFRMEKMVARIKAEGRENLIDDEVMALMQKLDGKTGQDYNWQSVVYGEPLVWIEADIEQGGAYVNVKDCD